MTLAFWFDYACPFSYLASTQVEALAARTGARLRYEPVDRWALAEKSGVVADDDPRGTQAKRRHARLDAERHAALFGVPILGAQIGEPSEGDAYALRATLAAGAPAALVHGLFHARWVEGRTLDEEAVKACLVGPVLVQDADVDERVRAALAHGIFATPSFVVAGARLFWGHDRLPFVEQALRTTTRSA